MLLGLRHTQTAWVIRNEHRHLKIASKSSISIRSRRPSPRLCLSRRIRLTRRVCRREARSPNAVAGDVGTGTESSDYANRELASRTLQVSLQFAFSKSGSTQVRLKNASVGP